MFKVFSRKILVNYKNIFVIVTFCIILYLLWQSYTSNRSNIIEKSNLQKSLIEMNVIETLRYAEKSYEILESQLSEEMEEYSLIMLEKYKENPRVSNWNLEELKDKFEKYEIYILDENLVITETTFPKDLGLNFNEYPNFANLLSKRLEGDSFESDRLDISTTTGKVKKYSYMPTPDHKYLLELSIDISKYFPIMEELNIFAHADTLIENYDSIREISFYKFNEDASQVGQVHKEGELFLDTDITDEDKNMITSAIHTDNIHKTEKTDKIGPHVIKKFIPYLNYHETKKQGDHHFSTEPQNFSEHSNKNEELNLDWWSSYVVGITYDDTTTALELSKERNLFLMQLSTLCLVFLIFNYSINYMIKHTEQAASIDPLTGLPGRKYFMENLYKLSKRSAVFFVDLDNFKTINDTKGHEVGDKVLVEVAKRLRDNLRKEDIVIRAGGDEFLILIKEISYNDAKKIASKIINTLDEPALISGKKVKIQASIGISIFPEHSSHPEDLLKKADVAMYKAKENKEYGKSTYIFYPGSI